MTQREMGELLGLCRRQVHRLEHEQRGTSPRVLDRFRIFLTLRGPRQRLVRAGVPHPFAADLAAAVAAWNRAARRAPQDGPARPCAVCGVAMGLHPRCRACPQLLGILHEQPSPRTGSAGTAGAGRAPPSARPRPADRRPASGARREARPRAPVAG
jgi:hypothetical protein